MAGYGIRKKLLQTTASNNAAALHELTVMNNAFPRTASWPISLWLTFGFARMVHGCEPQHVWAKTPSY